MNREPGALARPRVRQSHQGIAIVSLVNGLDSAPGTNLRRRPRAHRPSGSAGMCGRLGVWNKTGAQ